jgi:hypothetical protein
VKNTAHRLIISTAIVLSLPSLTAAQETPAMPGQSGDDIPRLELARDPLIEHGQVGAVQGTVGPDGLRFVVAGLSILQPIAVMLLARDEADDLTLSLFKKDWTNVRRTASTRGSGIARFQFRTQGGVNIMLRGASIETPFALVVWAGEERQPAMPDVVVTYDEFRKRNPTASASLVARGASTNQEPLNGDGDRSRAMPVIVWIILAAVGGGLAAFFSMRALGRRTQT